MHQKYLLKKSLVNIFNINQKFQEILDLLRKEDKLIITSMDRLSRNYNDLKGLFHYFSTHQMYDSRYHILNI